MKELSIEELHVVLLDIAKEFHRICVKHDIPYYMLGGTMLGAVRHKGFIPWDDDMDFGVLSKDFPRLVSLLEAEMPPRYRLRRECNRINYVGRLLKIEDTFTLNKFKDENLLDEMGAFIDIFPLTKTNGKKVFFSKNGVISMLLKLHCYRFKSYKESSVKKRFISAIIKSLFCWMRSPLFRICAKKIDKDDENGNFLVNYWGSWINKELVPQNVMGTPILYVFEDTLLYGVEKSDAYLASLYGNYMQMPPEKERHVHISHVYLR